MVSRWGSYGYNPDVVNISHPLLNAKTTLAPNDEASWRSLLARKTYSRGSALSQAAKRKKIEDCVSRTWIGSRAQPRQKAWAQVVKTVVGGKEMTKSQQPLAGEFLEVVAPTGRCWVRGQGYLAQIQRMGRRTYKYLAENVVDIVHLARQRVELCRHRRNQ